MKENHTQLEIWFNISAKRITRKNITGNNENFYKHLLQRLIHKFT